MSFPQASSSQPDSNPSSSYQWDNFLRNLGEWRGSFTRLSPQGQVDQDTPSTLILEKCNQNQVRLTLKFFSPETGALEQEKSLAFESIGPNIVFFENGAFSQGSLQVGPFSQFGGEFGFVAGDRRLRVVQLYNPESHLSQITLIREQRAGSNAPERPPLSVENLLGTWQGHATTRYADLQPTAHYETQLVVERQGDRLYQHIHTAKVDVSSSASISGSTLLFDQGGFPIQVLLLPDGGSSATPLTVPKGQPFFLEVGWLLETGLRQRLIRSYDAQGRWLSVTQVIEQQQ